MVCHPKLATYLWFAMSLGLEGTMGLQISFLRGFEIWVGIVVSMLGWRDLIASLGYLVAMHGGTVLASSL